LNFKAVGSPCSDPERRRVPFGHFGEIKEDPFAPAETQPDINDWIRILKIEEMPEGSPQSSFWSNLKPFGCTSRSRFEFAQDAKLSKSNEPYPQAIGEF